jgi:flagellar biosynthesis protein FlhF
VSRLGATEQILRYGEILRLPTALAYNVEDLRAALAESPAGRTMLVDTAAFAAGEGAGLEELQELLAAVPDAVVVLTAAAGTSQADLRRLAATSELLGADALALTKLDETDEPGLALSVVARLRLPPILCSTGRDVLADIETVSVAELAVAVIEACGPRDAERAIA